MDSKIEILFAEPELAQAEQRIFRSLLGQRIHSRDRMAKRSISVNQSVDPRLERTLPRYRAWRRSGGSAVSLRQISQLESFEECGPARIDRRRIFLPTRIILVDQLQIRSSSDGCAHCSFNLHPLAPAAS